MTARHGVQRSVDGLVGQPHRIRHTSQCARDLRRTQALMKMVDHGDPQPAASHQLAGHTRSMRQDPRTPIGSNASIPARDPGLARTTISASDIQPLRRISRRIVERARLLRKDGATQF